MGTETARIDSKTMSRLRKYLAKKTDGHIYGKISKTIETAIKEYMDRKEGKT